MPNPITPNWRTALATGALVFVVASYGSYTADQHQRQDADAEEAAAIATRQWAAEVICQGNRYHWADAHTLVCKPAPSATAPAAGNASPAAHTPLSSPIAAQ